MVVPVYGRNNMSWEDDRCASAFVSSKDPAAMWFAKYVVSTVRDNIRNGLTTNIQYAMAVFEQDIDDKVASKEYLLMSAHCGNSMAISEYKRIYGNY